MHPRRVIAKARRALPRRVRTDLLCSLPADVSAQIIDQLREDDLRRVPQVCAAWASLFAAGSALEPSLRSLVARRFGLRERPPHAARLSWGELYLALRRERCHLCPAADVAPFVYAGSSSLAMMLQCGAVQGEAVGMGLTLFPVCKVCFRALMNAPRDSFVPVVESKAVGFVFPSAKGRAEARLIEIGFLYSDIPGFRGKEDEKGIEYVLARPLAQACESHGFRTASDAVEPDSGAVLE